MELNKQALAVLWVFNKLNELKNDDQISGGQYQISNKGISYVDQLVGYRPEDHAIMQIMLDMMNDGLIHKDDIFMLTQMVIEC